MERISVITFIIYAVMLLAAEPQSLFEAGAGTEVQNEQETETESYAEPVQVVLTGAYAKSSDKIEISWEKEETAEGYVVYRCTQADGTYQQIGKTDKSVNSYIDSGLAPGNTYYYKVGAAGEGKEYVLSEAMGAILLEKGEIQYVKSVESGTLAVSWKRIQGAEGYLLYRKNQKNGHYEQIAELTSGEKNFYHDRDVKTNTVYSYKVKAMAMQNGKKGSGSVSKAVSGISVGKTSITSVTSLESGALQIKWKKIKGVYCYQLYRSANKDGAYKKIAVIKAGNTKYEDKKVKAGRKYYYKIRTVNRYKDKNGTGSYSESVYGILAGRPVISYVKSVSATSLKIGWKKIEGANGYRIYRSTLKTGKYKKIATIKNGKTVTYTDKKLKTEQNYYYKIQALNKVNGCSGCGKCSAIVSGKTLSGAEIKNVGLTAKKKIKLTWKKVSGANGYEIARSTLKNGKYKVIRKIKSGDTLSYTDNNAAVGKRYYYKVRAIHTDGKITGYGNYSRAKTTDDITLDTDWRITQYGNASGNQLMFYTLQDYYGHLIVVDGGWANNADMVREVIQQQGGHVDAWILTHPHEDHITAFCDIYENPGNVVIDKVYTVEMASPELCLENAPWDGVETYNRFRTMNISQLEYVHTGDVIKVGKLKIEILSAYEKKIDEISSDLQNDGSMMFRVYGKEESMLFCADVGKSVSNYLKEKYGKKLKSDYLQMGHHGNGGLKKDFYKMVNPDVAFFDAPDWLMNNEKGTYTTPQNKKLMEEMGSTVVSFETAPNTVILK